MFITPAVVGDHVFIGSCSGLFVALNQYTGDVVWEYDTSLDGETAQFHGDPWVNDNVVVVGADAKPEGHLYAFDAAAGDVLWKHAFAGGLATTIRAHGGVVYGMAVSGEVVAVDRDSGVIRWTIDPPLESELWFHPDPVLIDGVYYVAWRSGIVRALAADTGETMWSRELNAVINTSMAAVGDGLVLGTMDGLLYRIDIASGRVDATFDTGGMLYGDIVSHDNHAMVLWGEGKMDEEMQLGGPHVIASVTASLDRVMWQHSQKDEWSTYRPLVYGDVVVAGSRGQLVMLGIADGQPSSEVALLGTPRGLGASDGVLFVGTLQGTVSAFSFEAIRSP